MPNELVISYEDARMAAETVVKAAGGRRIAVAVTDPGGDVIYATRQDGASAVDVRNAERKAYTAAVIGRDTSLWRNQIAHDGRTVADWSDANTTTSHGGWTLRRDSQVIGGLGVAGSGTEDRDEQLALKGAEAAAQLSVDVWLTKRDPTLIRDR